MKGDKEKNLHQESAPMSATQIRDKPEHDLGPDGDATPLRSTVDGDTDAAETGEWLDSLEGVLLHEGPDRARFLLTQLKNKAIRRGVEIPFTANTPYINTIPV